MSFDQKFKMKRSCIVKSLNVFIVVCLLTSIILLLAHLALPHLIHNQILSQVKLLSNTNVFDKWKNQDSPMYFQVYLFDVKNPDDVIKGEKPILIERGPYTYRQWEDKQVLGWTEDYQFLQYRVHKRYEFDPARSVGNETDLVTTMNIPLVIGINFIENITPIWARKFAIKFLKMSEKLYAKRLFAKHQVKELLFEGYTETLLVLLAQLHKHLNISIPSYIPMDGRFSLLGATNDTDDGLWEVNTGIQDSSKIAQLHRWNNAKSLSCWKGPECNSLNGTDGVLFEPFISNDARPEVFIDQFNRSIRLTYEHDELYYNLKIKKFIFGPENFARYLDNKDNFCFATQSDDINYQYSGFVDVSSCVDGLPITFSQPHFYQGSSQLVNQFVNLNPNKTLHETFSFVEPTLGFTLNARKAMQLNLDLKSLLQSNLYPKFNVTMFPLLWFSLVGSASQQDVQQIQQQVYIQTQTIKDVISSSLIFFCFLTSLLFILIVIIYFVASDDTPDDQSPLIADNSNETEIPKEDEEFP